MSSSFRNPCIKLVAAAAVVLGTIPAFAQQTQYLPSVEVQADWNSNRELRTSDKQSRTGYRGTLETRIRRITPRSDTELRPAISYQKYSGRSDLDNLEGLFDLRSRYQLLKGDFSILGRFRRQDAFNAELGQAVFDDGDPETPPEIPTGAITGGITRTSVFLAPSFSYSITQRFDIEAAANYNFVNYDSNLARERVGFTSPGLDLQLVRRLSERWRIGFGPYWSHYKADDNSSKSDSYGAQLSVRWKTSEITRSRISLRAERNKDVDLVPVRVEDTSTAWGVEWVGNRENRVGSTEYRIGRFLQPTTLGGRRQVDQFQVQLDRPLSHTTLVRGALLYLRANQIGSNGGGGSDRDQANASLMVRHFFTESFFVLGGYRFAWVKRDELGNANNSGVFVSIGLRKRDPNGGFVE